MSLDIRLSPNIFVNSGDRQFVAVLRSALEKYKCLTVQMTWVIVVKWLATRNPKHFVMGSNQISRFFSLIVFFFLSLFSFLCLVFFCCSFLYFQHYFPSLFQIFNAKNTKWISNFSFASCVCFRIHYITVLFPFAGCICIRISFISFRPEPFETNMMVEVPRLLRCPGCLLARLSGAFAKCRIKI